MKNLSRLIFGILISIFLFGNNAFSFYSDVSSSHKYYGEIKALYDFGLLAEEPGNMFYPDSALKTPDLYKFILSYGEIPLPSAINLPYSDTENTAIYSPYIQAAIDLKILRPSQNSTLGVNLSVTKKIALETMFKILGVGIDQLFDRTNFYFKDLSANSDVAPLAEKTYEIGIFEEDTDMFRMAKTITRGEAAHYLYMIDQYSPMIRINYIPVNQNGYEITEDPNFDTLSGVYSAIKNKYLYQEEIDKENLIYDAINGILSQIRDKYTVFQKPSSSSILDSLSKEYEGVGMSLDLIDGNITIVSPFKNSPAEKAGLKANDVIIKVDNKNVTGDSAENVATKLKGKKGTTVKVTILRNGTELSFTLTRETIQYQSVQYEIKKHNGKNIAYIDIVNFGEDAYSQFLEAANEIIKDKSIKGIILDLRNNPGGYMDISVDIIGLFTDKIQTAVTLKFTDGSTKSYKTDGKGLLKGYKTVVLINEGSASASEIVAGALKDLELATIIGKRSFGKGSVQEIMTYDDGSVFKYTISYWLTPNGNNINKTGIAPDKYVTNTAEEDTQLNTALAEF